MDICTTPSSWSSTYKILKLFHFFLQHLFPNLYYFFILFIVFLLLLEYQLPKNRDLY